jgi:methyl-accepting chemotaxis protein
MRRNPAKSEGLSTDTILLMGMGTVLLGAIVYAIYEIQQTNEQIASASGAASTVGEQIGQASSSAQNVADQIAAANQTVQQQAQSPAVQAAQGAANWWNSL